jgi:uncharacterized membrane protein YecN with MAPEG domain
MQHMLVISLGIARVRPQWTMPCSKQVNRRAQGAVATWCL